MEVNPAATVGSSSPSRCFFTFMELHEDYLISTVGKMPPVCSTLTSAKGRKRCRVKRLEYIWASKVIP